MDVKSTASEANSLNKKVLALQRQVVKASPFKNKNKSLLLTCAP